MAEIKGSKIRLGLEGHDPEVETDDEAEDTADGGHPAAQLEPSSCGGDYAGNSEEECDEDEDGIHDTGYIRICSVSDVNRMSSNVSTFNHPPVRGNLWYKRFLAACCPSVGTSNWMF